MSKTLVQSRDNHIPERIRLPDGREFVTADLFAARTKKISYNLKCKMRQVTARKPKYSDQERAWIAQATPLQIQVRYDMTPAQARGLLNSSRNMLKNGRNRELLAAPK
jgi:hypothetical protein